MLFQCWPASQTLASIETTLGERLDVSCYPEGLLAGA